MAQRMGYGKAFSYASAAEIFAEHAALSASVQISTIRGNYLADDVVSFKRVSSRCLPCFRKNNRAWPRKFWNSPSYLLAYAVKI